MNKGNNSNFDMKDFFEKQKASSTNKQFNQTDTQSTKTGLTPSAGTPVQNPAPSDNNGSGSGMPFEIDKETEAQILEIVNSFINLANQHSENRKLPINIISDAFLYAAARYNAFLVASADKRSVAANQKEYMDAFLEQYKTMLKDHFDFYKSNPL